MPLTLTAAIPDALLTHLIAFAASPEIGLALPGRVFVPIDGEPYLEAVYLPNRTDTRAIGDNDAQDHQGLLQVSVMWPSDDDGLIPALDLAGQVINHFAKGTRLSSDGVLVRIERKGWVAPHLQEPDRLRVPVTIPYRVLA